MARDFSKDNTTDFALGTGVIGALIDKAPQVSLHTWVWIDAISVGGGNQIFTSKINGTGAGPGMALGGTSGEFLVQSRSVSGDTTQAATSSAVPRTGRWTPLGGLIDYQRGFIRLYVDGAADVTAIATFANPAYTMGTATAADRVGRYESTTVTEFFDGRIAELAVYAGDIGDAGFALLAGNDPRYGRRAFAPGFVRPDLLRFWMPLQGIASPEPDVRSGVVGAITGTVGSYEHPPVLYQTPRRVVRAPSFNAAYYRRRRQLQGAA